MEKYLIPNRLLQQVDFFLNFVNTREMESVFTDFQPFFSMNMTSPIIEVCNCEL